MSLQGALLASAASLLGLGTDLGGSIRIPCMFNGIFGHKPSTGMYGNGLIRNKLGNFNNLHVMKIISKNVKNMI